MSGVRRHSPSYTSTLVQYHTNEILRLCPEDMSSIGEGHTISSSNAENMKKALQGLRDLCENTPRSIMQQQIRSILVITNVYILYYFYTLNKFKHYKKARKVCAMLLDKILPEQASQIISNVFDFITINKLWISKVCIKNLLLDMIKCKAGSNNVFKSILNLINEDQEKPEDLLMVLHDMLVKAEWYKETHLTFIMKIRNMYVENRQQSKQSGLDACIRRVCERLNAEDIFELVKDMIAYSAIGIIHPGYEVTYYNTVEYVASFYRTVFYEDLTSKDLLQNVFNLIVSENAERSLFGMRLLQNLLDRNGNRFQLQMPKILFDFSRFPIRCGRYSPKDKDFLSEQRESLYMTLMSAFENHGDKIENLNAIFCCLAMVMVEVPCGLTTAWGSWLLLSMQEVATETDNMDITIKHRIHAVVVAGFSVMCWVHKAETLYKYVSRIIAKRSLQAPHLNPPLKTEYNYEQHHVTWDKPDLLFEEWEVRFGLWTAFNKPAEKIVKPVPRNSIRMSFRLFRKSE